MQETKDDDWRFQIFPQDVLMAPDMNSVYKPYVVNTSLEKLSPNLLSNQILLEINGNMVNLQEFDNQVAAPWQVWDQNEQVPSPITSNFSLFSPTAPFFSAFDSNSDDTNQSHRKNLSISTNRILRQQSHQSALTAESNAGDSFFPFVNSPLESDVAQHQNRRISSMISPLALQFSQTLSTLRSPVAETLTPMNSSFGGEFPCLPIKPTKLTVSKKTRKDKDGKETKCFPCDMCASTFSRNHDLKRHIRYYHS